MALYPRPGCLQLIVRATGLPRDGEIRYGTATLMVSPKSTEHDLDDIVAVIAKVHSALVD
jgi:hypothetical protein